jgi:ankyrin repeat protein
VDHVDGNGWSALHHAADASSYSWRAMEAALVLVEQTPPHVINAHTTGSQPSGYTCLHFACDGSDKKLARAGLVDSMLRRGASVDSRDDKGNTAFLLASATGVTDVVEVLVHAGADVNVKNDRGLGCMQSAKRCSGETTDWLLQAGVAPYGAWVPSVRQRTGEGDSESRQMRYIKREVDRDDSWKRSRGK